ncbi:low temperature requirement protein A [Leekyejoonella antrihumi]|uniref:Low temperature requirement protein A n=1 Tax=Leekyejoonella antrihumi TaxID=1660198 RepID=A0A563DVF7_9MICO|nr:low temperature requirement protein A [Leekyejoonella antrihumi]
MQARDPHEEGRGSSPLELLFDLTFVIGVGVAAESLTDLVAGGRAGPAIVGFVFAMFAILAGWINFSWFASAFDSDDWGYRICTMIQMIGVVVLALGLPSTFHSIEVGRHVDVRLLVAGYVVMRVGMVALWWRAARGSSTYRRVATRNASAILVVQVCWVVFALVNLSLLPTFVVIAALGTLELLIPVFAQGRASGTPWHPHHIADRYSAFAIIALGEGVVGTVASSRSALGGSNGLHWDGAAVLIVIAGVGLTFAMWWTYFLTPFGDLLHHRPARGYLFGYGHIPVLMAIAATGAGLHGAGLFLQGDSHLSGTEVMLAVAGPVAIYLLGVYGLHTLLFGTADGFHLVLMAATLTLLAISVAGTAAGLAMPVALLIVTTAAFIPVVGYECVGHRHQTEMLRSLAKDSQSS